MTAELYGKKRENLDQKMNLSAHKKQLLEKAR